jgi:hypothetical protein
MSACVAASTFDNVAVSAAESGLIVPLVVAVSLLAACDSPVTTNPMNSPAERPSPTHFFHRLVCIRLLLSGAGSARALPYGKQVTMKSVVCCDRTAPTGPRLVVEISAAIPAGPHSGTTCPVHVGQPLSAHFRYRHAFAILLCLTAFGCGADARTTVSGRASSDSASSDGVTSTTEGVVAPDDASTAADTPSTMTQGIAEGVTATGRVLAPDGTPVPRALIDPIAVDGQVMAGSESLRMTDANGRYQLVLPSGRWDLAITADGFVGTSVRIVVPTQGRVEADVTLEHA